MTLDEDVLRDVEAARQLLESLEDSTYEARAALHQGIRRLHATGASMREIATALGISHQRIHQIIGTDGIVEVEPAPPSEVTKFSRTFEATVAVTAVADACSFCGAPRRELDKLLAAAGPVFICGSCVALAFAVVSGGNAGTQRLVPVDEDATCSYCGNASAIGGVMVEAEDGSPRICRRCVETSVRLLETREQKKPATRRSTKVRCSFCNVSQTDTKKLVAGPGIYICEGCIAASMVVVETGEQAKTLRQVVLRPVGTESDDCSFCGKPAKKVARIVKAGRARICNECIDLCVDIIREEL